MGTVLIALEGHGMNDDRESVAWHAVNALIEDAKCNFKAARGEAFAWAIYNAVRRTKAEELGNLRELLQKHRINIHQSVKQTWSN
jgi:precorrin-3B methylase